MDPNPVTTRDSFWACVAGALVYGVFYLGAVIMLALRWRAPWETEVLSVAAAGAAYLSFFLQMGFARLPLLVLALVLLSILLGLGAGVWLLVFMLLIGG